MHGYYTNRKYLERKIQSFIGGQFQMKTKEGLVFRGQILNALVPDPKQKKIRLSFSWLCEKRLFFDGEWKIKTCWVEMNYPLGVPFLEVAFSCYYSQNDEGRIKMWGGGWNEVCYFFQSNDHTNLIKTDAGFKSYAEIHELHLIKVWIGLLTQKKKVR